MAEIKKNAKKAADEAVDATKKAAKTTKKAAGKTADAVEKAADKTAAATKKAAGKTADAVEKAADKTVDATKDLTAEARDDVKKANVFGLGALGAGVLALIFSVFNHYVYAKGVVPALGVQVREGGVNAWHGWALVGSLLVLAAVIVLVAAVFFDEVIPAGPWNLVAATLAGVGTLILIIRGLTLKESVDFGGILEENIGIGWSGWALIVAGLATTVLAALAAQGKGAKAKRKKAKR
ncbi:MAG: hypothetical protein QM728_00150 [Gordonia sp. (in: high G+C Gram-positive bacteria)]|uniref:hypothetical protein n=1 Tax=Gordonia sp. (in: high G+C Gram-positive bacteria) TaxID=84139 RepID=UPI0039E43BE5